MDITVAICTWNRARLLDQTLSAMHNLSIPEGIQWELLVINNNCTDDTDTVIARHMNTLPIRRLFESKQGHSNARNCAIAHTQGDLLVWTDDDVLVSSEWLTEYVKAAAAFPQAGYFGGTVAPWFEVEPPRWVAQNLTRLEAVFALRQLGPEVRQLAATEQVFGANMAFRMHLLSDSRFDPSLGRVGTGMISGDETEFICRLRKQGHVGVWVGTAKVRHYVPAKRMTSDYVWKFFHGSGRTIIRTDGFPVQEEPTLWGAPRWMYRLCWLERARAFYQWLSGQDWVDAYAKAALRAGMVHEIRAQALLGSGPSQ